MILLDFQNEFYLKWSYLGANHCLTISNTSSETMYCFFLAVFCYHEQVYLCLQSVSLKIPSLYRRKLTGIVTELFHSRIFVLGTDLFFFHLSRVKLNLARTSQGPSQAKQMRIQLPIWEENDLQSTTKRTIAFTKLSHIMRNGEFVSQSINGKNLIFQSNLQIFPF